MKNKLVSGAAMNIMLQATLIISGLIVPNLIIRTYGSEVNGMISSINQLLSYITLLESGIGGVIKSELYGPLLHQDGKALGGIINAANSFFRKIGLIFIVYLLGVAGTFYFITPSSFDYGYVFWLVIILGISIVCQYFIGITYQLFLQADQNYWFTSAIQIGTLWLNILCTVVFIRAGASIHMVKLTTALLFALRPACYCFYVRKKYTIDYHAEKNKKALSQRWDGFGHHIAYFIHTNTDIVLITVFLNLMEVSVYSVYLMIVTGVRSFIAAVSSAVEPYLGMLIAKKDEQRLQDNFSVYEFFHFFITTILFGATLVLILPFISVYSSGVSDVNYSRPIFAVLMIAAEGFYCLRNPYSSVVFAAGHFKQTKKGAFVEAAINIICSLLLIRKLGITGVVIGTLVAMVYRTIEYVVYLSKNILKRPPVFFFTRVAESAFSLLLIKMIFSMRIMAISNYFQWALYAIIVCIVSAIVTTMVFLAGSFKDFMKAIKVLRGMKGKKDGKNN